MMAVCKARPRGEALSMSRATAKKTREDPKLRTKPKSTLAAASELLLGPPRLNQPGATKNVAASRAA